MTPTESMMMNGLLLPNLEPHLSDSDPMIGVKKNPTSGDKHQMRLMCSCPTPIDERS
jgi:hypothetical protein